MRGNRWSGREIASSHVPTGSALECTICRQSCHFSFISGLVAGRVAACASYVALVGSPSTADASSASAPSRPRLRWACTSCRHDQIKLGSARARGGAPRARRHSHGALPASLVRPMAGARLLLLTGRLVVLATPCMCNVSRVRAGVASASAALESHSLRKG